MFFYIHDMPLPHFFYAVNLNWLSIIESRLTNVHQHRLHVSPQSLYELSCWWWWFSARRQVQWLLRHLHGAEMSEVVSRCLHHRQLYGWATCPRTLAMQWLEVDTVDSNLRPSSCKAQNISLHHRSNASHPLSMANTGFLHVCLNAFVC